MPVKTGLEVLVENKFQPLLGKKVGVLCNQASINRNFEHILSLFAEASGTGLFKLCAVFGPQHGLWGHTQDNMIEWEGSSAGDIPLYSLYGTHRKPTAAMLNSIDTLVIDLQDVGTRYYTFIWTMALCMEAALENSIEIIVLDRPNPLGGIKIEGPMPKPAYRSFVGLYPLPVCHGMTIGEIACYLRKNYLQDCHLQIIKMSGWRRNYGWRDTNLPWGMPSPNIPSPETTEIYPGLCLLEATNISEGRGTTRPFEIFGAPWMDAENFCRELNACNLPGVHFQPFRFQPTFNKYAGEFCQGAFIRVTSSREIKPFRTGLTVLRECIRRYPDHFEWKDPPYEYEEEKLPFDILVGNSKIRKQLHSLEKLGSIEQDWKGELKKFRDKRLKELLYE